jgi:two-component sensor histidine kinase
MRRTALWTLNISLWTSIALLQSFQSYSAVASEGMTPHFDQILLLQIATWCPWAFIAAVLFTVCSRYPLEQLISVRSIVLFPLLGLASVALQILIHTAAMVLIPTERGQSAAFPVLFGQMFRWMALPGFIVYAGIIGAGHAFNYYRKYRERELRTLELERQLTEAQLATLQMQLQPHFFFNTLHSIASLVRDRQHDEAVSMIARLSELLRYTLDQADNQKVPLSQELEFIYRYLEIEQTRFPDRLKIDLQIQPESLAGLVPTLLLQPLVENAIKHGISHLTNPGTLGIRAQRIDHRLELAISNDGIGLNENGRQGERKGLGLSNARERLQQLYGEHHKFELIECGDGRVSASISLPFEETGVGVS